MKVYKRLTRRDGNVVRHIETIKSSHLANRMEEEIHKEFELIHRLADLEDKIESGELCEREEVRKETAREILKTLYETRVRQFLRGGDNDMFIYARNILVLAQEYGIELFGKTEQVENSDKLEDEE